MSLSISGTTIRLTRGDSLKIIVTPINVDGSDYEAEDGDVIRFAMKKSYNDQEPLIEKNIPVDTYLLELDPSDTKKLRFGEYVYDVELTHANGDVDTYISEATFIITKEVY